jgi:hypothetical protein
MKITNKWIYQQPEFKYPMIIFGSMIIIGILLMGISFILEYLLK